MSDFFSSSWSLYISIITLVSIVGCFWLAWTLSSRSAPKGADGTTDTTGHVWDGDLSELNNPLPRWWLNLFYITCIFGLGYLLLFPGLGTFKGLLGWSSTGRWEAEVAEADARYSPLFDQYKDVAVADLAKNPEAVQMGQSLFLTYCSQCHGSDARGSRGFPNLADNDWLGTGTGEYIEQTIMNGRNGVMAPMGAAIGGPEEATKVAHYVLSLSDSDHDAALAAEGKGKFAVCMGCHGPDAKGNPAIGAPNLTDDNWLHGRSLAAIEHAINNGLTNHMPAFGPIVGDSKAHLIAGYVYSLSN